MHRSRRDYSYDDVYFYLECGLAEMVTVECPSYLEVKEGVLLKEGFVTVNEMERKMSVMEHRMESWTNRMRDLDREAIFLIPLQCNKAESRSSAISVAISALIRCCIRRILYATSDASYAAADES